MSYEAAVESLLDYCDKNTDLTPVIIEEEYPFCVQFIPNQQQTFFGNENVDENGEVNDMIVTVGLTTTVKSTLKFKMDSKELKKLIRLAESTGRIYYQAFRESAGDLRPDKELRERLRAAVENAPHDEDVDEEDNT